jgi:2-phospho-L-lactate/phosphoenolpyruvate guanylyltransferase
MRALLLPIKDLRHAKQRLAHVLTPEERFGLAQAMLADTIRAVRGVRRAEKIFVVTNYAPVIHAAEENGWEILSEEQQISESASVDAASRQCEELGITAVLRLPLDVPLVRASDIDELLAAECAPPGVVIVPSRDGTGTNAILRTPPALFPSYFGSGSFAKHCDAAQRAGALVFLRRNARLEMDVDDEGDLRALAQQDLSGTETGLWLRESGVSQRLRLGSAAVAKTAAKI